MKRKASVHARPLGLETDSGGMVLYFGISFLIHLIFIGSMVLMPESAPRRRLAPGAINVSLVSLPGPPAAAPAPAPAAKPATVMKEDVKPAPKTPAIEIPPPKPLPAIKKPDKTVSLAPKPKKKVPLVPKPEKKKPKKSLKKETQDRRKMIERAVSNVKKDVEKSRSDSVKQAIDRLKKKVAQTESKSATAGTSSKSSTGAVGAGGTGAAGFGGARNLEVIDLYKIEVAFQVERQWAFSEQLAGGGALQTSLVFRVLPSGEITDIRFTERSGNAYLDESAYKAVVKANPVSPHPEGIRAPFVMVAIRFTPEGMRK